MANDDDLSPRKSGGGAPKFDGAPDRFRESHASDGFSGASGVLFEQAMAQTRMAICLCDPHQEDLPIVFANRAFCALTGYSEDEVLGVNCRLLQGPETDPAAVERIRDALAREDVVVVELLNYRKDGSSFWNALHLGPIYNNEGDLVYFFGSQWDVSDVRSTRAREEHARELARQLSHRMKNVFSVISGVVNITGRLRGFPEHATEINERIQALGRAYETTLDNTADASFEIGEAIRAVFEPYGELRTRLNLSSRSAPMEFGSVSLVALTVHELVANARKHGAWSGEGGTVSVTWGPSGEDGDFLLEWREEGGPAIHRQDVPAGTGTTIVDRLLKSAGGSIERSWNAEGFSADIRLPRQKS